MKKILLTVLVLFSSVLMAAPELVSGDYEVGLRDRNGNIRYCTLNIQNYTSEGYIVLNIQDCPPVVTDVVLYGYENGEVFTSEKIPATTRRGGYKMYEIQPLSTTQFEMTSFREYGDGRVGPPRKITANLK